MTNIVQHIKAFVNEDSGQDLIEYALVAGIIGLGAVASMGTLATAIKGIFTSIGTSLTSAV
jgi:pilus assembly protein Flp/PilA